MAPSRGFLRESTEIGEPAPLLRVPLSRQGVRQVILCGGDPLGRRSEILGNLLCGEPPGHPQPDITPRSTFREKPVAGLIVCMNSDLFMLPLGRPQVERDNVSNQLEIRNGPVKEFVGDGTGEILV